MNDIQNPLHPDLNGNVVTETAVSATNTVPVQIENDDGPIIIEGEPVTVTDDEVADATSSDLSQRQVRDMADDIADALTDPDTEVITPDDPEFDRLHAVTRFLVGAAIEGTVEFTQRLKLWEAFVREEMPDLPADLSDASEQELLRYALIGFVFESEDTGRRLLKTLIKVPTGVAKTAVRPTKSVANSRFAGPFRRRLNRMADRGEEQIMRWIQRGYDEEPFSRNLARLGIQEVTDEFINQLAQNEEVQTLVQEQSMGLASEAVEQVRERTFTADTLVERLARAVTRRSPRVAPPMADLSEYPKKLPPGYKTGDKP